MVLKKEKGQWVLYSRKIHRKLGTFKTKKAAIKREKQIQYFKQLKGG